LFEMLVFKRPTNLIEFQNILINLMRGENSGDEYWFVKSSYFEFECDENNKLIRNREADVKILEEILKGYLNS
ncbi:MAG: hypothetical protein QMB65_00230, partial [Vicingaceae bacterium]